jgi:hypothetical protein
VTRVSKNALYMSATETWRIRNEQPPLSCVRSQADIEMRTCVHATNFRKCSQEKPIREWRKSDGKGKKVKQMCNFRPGCCRMIPCGGGVLSVNYTPESVPAQDRGSEILYSHSIGKNYPELAGSVGKGWGGGWGVWGGCGGGVLVDVSWQAL